MEINTRKDKLDRMKEQYESNHEIKELVELQQSYLDMYGAELDNLRAENKELKEKLEEIKILDDSDVGWCVFDTKLKAILGDK